MSENYLQIPSTKNTQEERVPIGSFGVINYGFQNTLSETEVYEMLKKSDLKGATLEIHTADVEQVRGSINETCINVGGLFMREMKSAKDFEEAMHVLRDIADSRYIELHRLWGIHGGINGISYETYEKIPEAHGKMNLILACFIGVDKLDTPPSEQSLKDMTQVLKVGRCTGVRFLMHSDKPGAIREILGPIIYPNFRSWESESPSGNNNNGPEPSGWMFGAK